MITIELKRILKEGVIIVLILGALMTGIFTSDKDTYLVPALEIFLLLYASFAGWSLFDRERNEGAMEYLMALPVSRSRLFFIKFIPRLFSISFLLLIYMLLHGDLDIFSLVPFMDFTVVYIAFFLVSMSFSLSIKSFIGAFFLTSLLSLGLAFVLYVIEGGRSILSVLFQANLSILVFPILFFIAFRRFDMKPLISFNRRFLLYFIGGGMFVVILTLFFMADRWCCHYLTYQGEVFRASNYIDCSEYIGKTHTQRFHGHLHVLQQDGRLLYCLDRNWGKGESETGNIVRLNLDTGKIQSLLKTGEYWHSIGTVGRKGVFLKNRVYFLFKNGDEREYKIFEIDRKGNKHREISVVGQLDKEARYLHLAFVTDSPLRFFIYSKGKLLRFDEKGGALDSMMEVDCMATWKNRLLVFNSEGVALHELRQKTAESTAQWVEVHKENGDFVMMERKFDYYGSQGCRHAIFRDRSNGGYYCFDLKKAEKVRIKLKTRPYDYLEVMGKFYIISVLGDDITVEELNGGNLVTRHYWTIQLSGWRRTQVFPAGILVHNNKEYDRFLFSN